MNAQVNIRKAEKTDIDDILLIETLCFETDSLNRRQFMYLLSKSNFFVAE
jgi:ribosomal protein S18 acetylase RimI-like enzyme